MLLLSASSKVHVHRSRQKPHRARRRGAFVSAPETLECRLLLASDIGAEQDAAAGDDGVIHGEPFPDFATVHGAKWNDQNANGERDANEPGVAGVTIYSDINRNGLFEDWEPSTVTIEGSPFEDFAESGSYWLDLEPGIHVIREVIPAGTIQTFPATDDPRPGDPDGEEPDEQDPDQFASTRPERLVLPNEPGLPLDREVALTVHPVCFRPFELDVVSSHPDVVDVINNSGPQLNGCGGDTTFFDVTIIPHQIDIPSLPGNLSLQFVDLLGGDVLAAIPIVPSSGNAGGAHVVELLPGDIVDGVDFGNHFAEPDGSVHGLKWADLDGDGQRDADEPGLPGVTIYADVNGNGRPDSFEPRAVTMEDHPDTDFDEAGMYWLEGVRPGENVIREVVPGGYRQTFPGLDLQIGDSELGRHHDGVALDLELTRGSAAATGGEVDVELELTVIWPDSCGNLADDLTSYAVVGDHILVELHGHQEGDACLAVISPESTTIEIPRLDDRAYTVVTTLHEDLRDGQRDVATLAAVTSIDVGHRDFHVVVVRPGQAQEGINFGNQPLPPGQVHGRKWLDRNGNAQRDDDEPGLAGVTIYADLNLNGILDDDEPRTVTMPDDPDTTINETGRYWLEELTPGEHLIREVVPEGFRQTFPLGFPFPPFLVDILENGVAPMDPNDDPFVFPNGAHWVSVGAGETVEGIDFGNQRVEPAQIHGIKWLDRNGNGARDDREPGLAGVTIYSDRNFNAMLDDDEPHTVTMDDDPNTDFDETGRYWLDGLLPGEHSIREVVPEGSMQTFPMGPVTALFDGLFPPFPGFEGAHYVSLENGAVLEGIDFGNRPIEPGSIHGTKWLDANGNLQRDDDEPGLAGVTIYVDLNSNGVFDDDEPHAETMADDLNTRVDESGRYWIEELDPGFHIVREVVPDGFVQTFPEIPPPPIPLDPADGNFPVFFDPSGGAHFVTLESGGVVEGIDFGNRRFEPANVHGTKWHDVNGNGQRDADEPGLPGVTIYVDLNHNFDVDEDEPRTVTMEDDPHTNFDESGMYWLPELAPGLNVVREVVPDGFRQTFPWSWNDVWVDGLPFPQPPPDVDGGHWLYLEVGDVREGVDFGNQELGSSSIHGVKWLDRNGNGQRDEGEPGVPGVVIYSDLNFNGQLDEGEPRTRTMEADSATGNRLGHYWLEVHPGEHHIREVVPDGFAQTFPPPSAAGVDSSGHAVFVEPGDVVDGIDFGNRPIDTERASIHGLKWLDRNGDGERENNEPGLPDVTIYLDVNWNSRFDDDEPHTVTMRDDPRTSFNETGRYWLEADPGFYLVREVVPDGFEQTFPPVLLCEAIFCDGRAHIVNLEPGQRLEGLDFGNEPIESELGSIHGRKWIDRNGNGQREDHEPGMPGVTIVLYNSDGLVARTETMEDNPDTQRNEQGEYWFEGLVADMYAVEEIVPHGFHQTFPDFPKLCHVIDLPAGSPFCTGPQHLVSLGPGQVIDGLDFGNQPLDNFPSAIHGTKWLDHNGNGRRDDGEPGLAGVTIWIDANLNGEFDADDPYTVTIEDDATTPNNEAGRYWFDDLESGFKVVHEVVPDGFEPTFPDPLFCRAIFCNGRGHMVTLGPGEVIEGLDFGNEPIRDAGQIRGVKWLDRNGNGQYDDNEPGLPGVTVYLDLNDNGSLERGEPRAETTFDNPRTSGNEAGHYLFRGLEEGTYVVREVVPDGFQQTFPNGGVAVGETIVIPRMPIHVRGFDLASASFLVSADGVRTVGVDFEVFWSDGCGSILHDESEVAIGADGQINVTVLTRNEQAWGDVLCTDDAPVHSTTVNVGSLGEGRHPLRTELREVTPDGEILAYVLESSIMVGGGEGSGSHTVRLEAGEIVDGVNFGNSRLPDAPRMVVWNALAAADVPNGWENEQNWAAIGEDVPAADAAPRADDVVVFGPGFANLIELASDHTIHSIRFMDDYQLVGSSTLAITSGQITVDEGAVVTLGVDVDAGEMLYKLGAGTLLITGSAPGDVQVDAGAFGGTTQLGSLNVAPGAMVAPGTSVGVIMADDVTFGESSTLEIEINGFAESEHDQLIAHGSVSLAGNLELRLLDEFSPTRGNTETITILTAAEVTGRFDEADPHLGRGVFYDVTYLSDAVQLSLYTALPGDANGDGRVDVIDFGTWYANAYGSGDWTDGDFDGNGIVDVRDFNIWNDGKFTVAQPASPGANIVPRAAAADGIGSNTQRGRFREALPVVVLKDTSEKLQRRVEAAETRNEATHTRVGATPTEMAFVRSSARIPYRGSRSAGRLPSSSKEAARDNGWTNLVDDAFAEGGQFELF